MWAALHALPLLTGLVLKAVFDRLGHGRPATGGALSLLAVLVAVEAVRALCFWSAMTLWPGWWQAVSAWLRANLLWSVLCAPGAPAERLPASPGEAVSRARDDVEDMVWFADLWVDLAGGVVFMAVALVVMLRIDAAVTVVVVLPLLGVLAATRAVSHLIRRYHTELRESGGRVTDYVADLFAGVLTVKTSGAEDDALRRFRVLNARRGRAAVRSQLGRDLIVAVSGASVELGTGLMLLLAAGAMRRGRFTVGDLALFVAYIDSLTELPRWMGRLLARQREAGIALDRLARVQPGRDRRLVLQPRPVYLRQPPPPPRAPDTASTPRLRLEHLAVAGLTALHPASGRGILDVSFTLDAGGLTVVTGAVGSGKTTLLRALLGLMPAAEGAVRWNGTPVDDLGSFLVPPRTAYVGQVPRLVSAPIEENVRLGWPADDDAFRAALEMAQFDVDVAHMPDRAQTVVGPRGSRLSGGQAQRATVARAVIRRPDLLVVDDISSALDVHTEDRLWLALASTDITCLAASHRRAVLERATEIIVLDRGRVAGVGTRDDLMVECAEFRRLWDADVLADAGAG
jgi:ATP-binding cassette subfamily B protein